MPKAKRGTEYVCESCGTTLVVTEDGYGVMEDIVCCAVPMVARQPKRKKVKKSAKKKK